MILALIVDYLSFVVKVDFIFPDEHVYQVGVSDFTGSTIAILSKSDGKNLQENDVLLLRNVQVQKVD